MCIRDSLKPCISYYTCCDFLLFDTRTSTGRGGSGKTFPWEILDNYHGPVPFLLSGGIAPEDFIKIKRFFHPKFTGIDLNSRFEIEPGLKDAEKLKRFIDHIKFTDRNEQD